MADAGQQSRTGMEHTSVSVTMMKRKAPDKKLKSRPTSQPQRNIVGCRIQHGWKDGDEPLRVEGNCSGSGTCKSLFVSYQI
uniref:Uncharacterized protein n=3 Tax=Canis lupus TaxID=9612 RepID=A0A8C0T8X2_CANLF